MPYRAPVVADWAVARVGNRRAPHNVSESVARVNACLICFNDCLLITAKFGEAAFREAALRAVRGGPGRLKCRRNLIGRG